VQRTRPRFLASASLALLAACGAPRRGAPVHAQTGVNEPAPGGFLETSRRDLAAAPRRVWEDGKLVYGERDNWLLLLGASAYALAQEQWLEENEQTFFENHTIYGRNASDALAALGNGLTLYTGAIAWYSIAIARGDTQSYAASKTLLSAMTVTAISSTVLKGIVPDGRPDGGSFDFPSGHASQSMAVASTLDELYGSRIGIPAYVLAGMVAVQRLDVGKHDTGSVVFGMVLGYIAGKTVARHHAPEIFGLKMGMGVDVEMGAPTVTLSLGF